LAGQPAKPVLAALERQIKTVGAQEANMTDRRSPAPYRKPTFIAAVWVLVCVWHPVATLAQAPSSGDTANGLESYSRPWLNIVLYPDSNIQAMLGCALLSALFAVPAFLWAIRKSQRHSDPGIPWGWMGLAAAGSMVAFWG
jgi:hypothetical protein